MKLIRLCLLGVLSGCSFMARAPDQYRDDTAALLDTRSPQVKACYDTALKTNPALSGQVTVKFTVEHDTGNITNVDTSVGTTAPPELAQCVSSSLAGLVLTPPDKRDGAATFVYDFSAPAAAPAPAAPAPAPG